MNTNAMIRSYMAKHKSSEEYLLHVGRCIERQLQEWNVNYAVNIMKFKNYEFVVKNGEIYYHTQLLEDEIEELKDKGPYALDRKIWVELARKGLEIKMGYGNYLERIF